jgi:hypothetical protein
LRRERDFALGQQPVAHLVVDLNACDLRQIESRAFGKGRKEGILTRGYRRGQLSAFEVLGVLIGLSISIPMSIVAPYAQAASATVGSPLIV